MDHRALLIKYMAWILKMENTMHVWDSEPPEEFTAEEWDYLYELSKTVKIERRKE